MGSSFVLFSVTDQPTSVFLSALQWGVVVICLIFFIVSISYPFRKRKPKKEEKSGLEGINDLLDTTRRIRATVVPLSPPKPVPPFYHHLDVLHLMGHKGEDIASVGPTYGRPHEPEECVICQTTGPSDGVEELVEFPDLVTILTRKGEEPDLVLLHYPGGWRVKTLQRRRGSPIVATVSYDAESNEYTVKWNGPLNTAHPSMEIVKTMDGLKTLLADRWKARHNAKMRSVTSEKLEERARASNG